MWESAGIVIRGVLTQALTKTSGPFAAGEKPGEADCKYLSLKTPVMFYRGAFRVGLGDERDQSSVSE